MALLMGRDDIFLRLVRCFCPRETRDWQSPTPLSLAVQYDRLLLVQILLTAQRGHDDGGEYVYQDAVHTAIDSKHKGGYWDH